MENILQSIFQESVLSTTLSVNNFMGCILVSVLIGLFLASIYMYKSKYTKSFVVTIALLPAIVCAVIIMVNGNLGTGVAVAGAFSLVRFRSVPGNAKEIGFVFLTMASGLATGMGYLGYAVLFAVVLGIFVLVMSLSSFGERKLSQQEKILRVMISEDLDYTSIFDEIFQKYTTKHQLTSVRTVNMGSMFRLEYEITLEKMDQEKEFIDALRCRNGNLEVACLRPESLPGEL